jgi:hypothetical protein
MADNQQHTQVPAGAILLPAQTAWPLVLALGLALSFAGLVTSYNMTLLGAILVVMAIIGWARAVFPVEQHEEVVIVPHTMDLEIDRRRVARIRIDESHRSLFPMQTYTVKSGILGGFAGGTAMIVLAELYGLVIHHSLWYPINLLGGAGVAGWVNPTEAELNSFKLGAVIIAIIIHTCTSFLVGLLYGALLPILPKHPVILGGLIGPALWTGLLHSTLALINPYFDSHVNWWWFAVSQVGFGLVAGLVVVKYGHVKSMRGAPLPVRLGLEFSERPDKEQE